MNLIPNYKIMQKRKGLVFDNQSYFSKIVKKDFQRHISFETHRDFKYFNSVLNNYSVIIFVIYSEDQIFDFMKVYGKGIPLIICTFNKERLIKLRRIDNVMLLDASKILPEIVANLRSYFTLVNLL